MRSSSFSQQGAKPGGVQTAQPEASQAEGAVVEVQTQTAQQLNDCGAVTPLHTHSQSPAEVLLVGASAEQELHQFQRSASFTHLQTQHRGHDGQAGRAATGLKTYLRNFTHELLDSVHL